MGRAIKALPDKGLVIDYGEKGLRVYKVFILKMQVRCRRKYYIYCDIFTLKISIKCVGWSHARGYDWDGPRGERFTGQGKSEASSIVSREYRAPYVPAEIE